LRGQFTRFSVLKVTQNAQDLQFDLWLTFSLFFSASQPPLKTLEFSIKCQEGYEVLI